jgi:hypothetical protein
MATTIRMIPTDPRTDERTMINVRRWDDICCESIFAARLGLGDPRPFTGVLAMGLDEGVDEPNIDVPTGVVEELCWEDLVGNETASVVVRSEDDGVDCCDEVIEDGHEELVEGFKEVVAANGEVDEVLCAADAGTAPFFPPNTPKGSKGLKGVGVGIGRSSRKG